MSELGNKEVLAKNLNRYISSTGKNRKEVCNDLGFKYTTFVDWCNAKTYPRIDKIELMARYFNIEKSDLIENQQNISEKKIKMRLLGNLADRLTLNDIDLIEKIIEKPRSVDFVKSLIAYIDDYNKRAEQ